MLEDFLKNGGPVYSLDIETTGTSNSRIWAVGMDSPGFSEEFHIGGVLDPSIGQTASRDEIAQAILQAHINDGAEVFGRKQMASDPTKPYGAFEGYIDAVQQGKLVSINEAVSKMNTGMDKPGILLTQNTQFEFQRFAEASEAEGPQRLSSDVKDSFRNRMPTGTKYTEDSSASIIARDKEIQKDSKDFSHWANHYKRDPDLKDFQKADLLNKLKATQDTITRVVNRNMSMGKQTAIDEMDITKIYLGKLSLEHNAISHQYLNTSLSINDLSKFFLGEAEKHTALSDAKQQRELFSNKLMSMINNLDSNGVSDLDKAFIKHLETSDIHERSFIRGLSNRIGEAEQKGKTPEQMIAAVERTKLWYESVPQNTPFKRGEYADEIVKQLKNGASPAELMKKMGEDLEKDTLPTFGKMKDAPYPHKGMIKAWNSLSKESKTMIQLGGIASAALLLMGGNSAAPKQKLTSYDDLYTNTTIGQPYADWKERNKSHKMMY